MFYFCYCMFICVVRKVSFGLPSRLGYFEWLTLYTITSSAAKAHVQHYFRAAGVGTRSSPQLCKFINLWQPKGSGAFAPKSRVDTCYRRILQLLLSMDKTAYNNGVFLILVEPDAEMLALYKGSK